jgi:Putative transposase
MAATPASCPLHCAHFGTRIEKTESLHEPVAFLRHLVPARKAEWVVYAKRPFAGPAQVLDYVGRYTHRVAISNNRLLLWTTATSASAG